MSDIERVAMRSGSGDEPSEPGIQPDPQIEPPQPLPPVTDPDVVDPPAGPPVTPPGIVA